MNTVRNVYGWQLTDSVEVNEATQVTETTILVSGAAAMIIELDKPQNILSWQHMGLEDLGWVLRQAETNARSVGATITLAHPAFPFPVPADVWEQAAITTAHISDDCRPLLDLFTAAAALQVG